MQVPAVPGNYTLTGVSYYELEDKLSPPTSIYIIVNIRKCHGLGNMRACDSDVMRPRCWCVHCSHSRILLDHLQHPRGMWFAAVLLPRCLHGPLPVCSRRIARCSQTVRRNPCGDATRTCLRGVVCRRKVQDAYYSFPENVTAGERYAEKPCEQDRYCTGGVPSLCEQAHCPPGVSPPCYRDYCWPRPFSVFAREALPGEVDSRNQSYFSRRMAGISEGDVVEVHFDENSTMPLANTTALVLLLINFTVPLGRDGFELRGKWVRPSVFFMTVVSGNWTLPNATDLSLTRPNYLHFNVEPEANLRCVGSLMLSSLCRDVPWRLFEVRARVRAGASTLRPCQRGFPRPSL